MPQRLAGRPPMRPRPQHAVPELRLRAGDGSAARDRPRREVRQRLWLPLRARRLGSGACVASEEQPRPAHGCGARGTRRARGSRRTIVGPRGAIDSGPEQGPCFSSKAGRRHARLGPPKANGTATMAQATRNEVPPTPLTLTPDLPTTRRATTSTRHHTPLVWTGLLSERGARGPNPRPQPPRGNGAERRRSTARVAERHSYAHAPSKTAETVTRN